MIHDVIEKWHAHLRGELPGGLSELLDDDVIFYSPVVFTPQRGKALAMMYLSAASTTFPGDESTSATTESSPGSFHYTKKVLDGDTAVLEFETMMAGKYVNGVDIIRCNDLGKIIEFRVMIRPLQAVNAVHQAMGATLQKMSPPQ